MDLFKAIEWYTRKQPSIYTCGEEYESLDWHTDNILPKPTKVQLEIAWKQCEADFQKREYQRNRQKEYPPIEAQLDVMYNQGFDGWFKHMRSIKMKYPSPNKDQEPELINPIDDMKKQIIEIQAKNEADLANARQELADLQAAIIDTKGAIYAIKGFMMEIPNIQKQLTAIESKLAVKT